jgi:hypothetical protein
MAVLDIVRIGEPMLWAVAQRRAGLAAPHVGGRSSTSRTISTASCLSTGRG